MADRSSYRFVKTAAAMQDLPAQRHFPEPGNWVPALDPCVASHMREGEERMHYWKLMLMAAVVALNVNVVRAQEGAPPSSCKPDGDKMVCCAITSFDLDGARYAYAYLVKLKNVLSSEWDYVSSPTARVRVRGHCGSRSWTSDFSTDQNCGSDCERSYLMFSCVAEDIVCAVSTTP
jgi:hypothetical protein